MLDYDCAVASKINYRHLTIEHSIRLRIIRLCCIGLHWRDISEKRLRR
jgi:hypothetical protein